MTLKVNTFFTEAELQEIRQTMKEILHHNGVSIRDTTIQLYVKGDADLKNHKGQIIHTNDLASRAWIMAVLMHLGYKGYEVRKK